MTGALSRTGLVLVFAAALALGGCFKISHDLPKDAPAYVKVYPGATQIMSIDAGMMKTVAFQVADTPATVILYYKTLATAAQMPESEAPNQTNAPVGQQSAVFGDPKDGGAFMVVVARPQAQGQGSTVSLMYKPAPKTGS